VIHRGEELADVGLKDITESLGELLAAIDRSVRAFAFAAGIRVGNNTPVKA
jgi:hypothetical protein